MTDMSAQPVVETRLPPGRSFTWDDLQSIPDEDYWRYQIVDGTLLVSPAPNAAHQSCVVSLAVLLRSACPDDLKVLVAPFDYAPGPGWVLQPDVLVVRRSDLLPQRVVAAPVLCIEVLSPSSRTTDRTLKHAAYEEHGVEHYWLVDPEAAILTAFQLRAGRYEQVGAAAGGSQWSTEAPFSVNVSPRGLLDA